MLLKRADEQLYNRFNDLGIPPQTYGMYVTKALVPMLWQNLHLFF